VKIVGASTLQKLGGEKLRTYFRRLLNSMAILNDHISGEEHDIDTRASALKTE